MLPSRLEKSGESDAVSGLARTTRSLAAGVATAALALCALGAIGPAHAQPASAITIDAQNLNSALRSLARQTGVQLLFDPAITRGRRAPAVRGAASPEIALRSLLANSGLTYQSNGRDTFTILAPAADEVRPVQTPAQESAERSDEFVVTGSRLQSALLRQRR